jgi:hypothetical protein
MELKKPLCVHIATQALKKNHSADRVLPFTRNIPRRTGKGSAQGEESLKKHRFYTMRTKCTGNFPWTFLLRPRER